MLLLLAIVESIAVWVKPGTLQFLRTRECRLTMAFAFAVALVLAWDANCAGTLQALDTAYMALAVCCFGLAVIPPRPAKRRRRLRFVPTPFRVTQKSAPEETPYRPPAR